VQEAQEKVQPCQLREQHGTTLQQRSKDGQWRGAGSIAALRGKLSLPAKGDKTESNGMLSNTKVEFGRPFDSQNGPVN
jgi:hypothetical protein